MYSIFNYHGSPTRPIGDERECIFGVELEIQDIVDTAIIDNAIDDNILTAPQNEDETRHKKTIENDGSVFAEVIINADVIPELFDRLECLNNYGFNDDNIFNDGGTSCHIHYNRRYLESIGIYEDDMTRIAEFLAPYLFRISGRSYGNFQEWTPSQIGFDPNANIINWRYRAIASDRVNSAYGRYSIINVENSRTIELRVFSNESAFHFETISSFILIADYLIQLAKEMKGKQLKYHYKEVLASFKEFIIKNTYFSDETDLLNDILCPEFENFQFYYRNKRQIIMALKHKKLHVLPCQNNYDNVISLIRICRDYNICYGQRTSISESGMNTLIKAIEKEAYDGLLSYSMALYRALSDKGIF